MQNNEIVEALRKSHFTARREEKLKTKKYIALAPFIQHIKNWDTCKLFCLFLFDSTMLRDN